MTKNRKLIRRNKKGGTEQKFAGKSSTGDTVYDVGSTHLKLQKRKQGHDESESGSTKITNTRPVKKIRLVVSKDKKDTQNDEDEELNKVAPTLNEILSPNTQQSILQTSIKRKQDNEKTISHQRDVKKLKKTIQSTSNNDKKYDILEKHPDISQKSINQLPLTKNTNSNSQDILNFFACPTPVEFTSPPEPLFPELNIQFSVSSEELADALFKSIGTNKNESPITTLIDTELFSQTTQYKEASFTCIDDSSQTIKFKEVSPTNINDTSQVDEVKKAVVNTEPCFQSMKSEITTKLEVSIQNQVVEEPITFHEEKEDQLLTIQKSPEEESKINRIKSSLYETPLSKVSLFKTSSSNTSSSQPPSSNLSLYEPLLSAPLDIVQSKELEQREIDHYISSSLSLTKNQTQHYEKSQLSLSSSRKGKGKATTTDYDDEVPTVDYISGMPRSIVFDKKAYEDILLQQELHSLSQDDKEVYLSRLESLLAYYKSIAKDTDTIDLLSSSRSTFEGSRFPEKSSFNKLEFTEKEIPLSKPNLSHVVSSKFNPSRQSNTSSSKSFSPKFNSPHEYTSSSTTKYKATVSCNTDDPSNVSSSSILSTPSDPILLQTYPTRLNSLEDNSLFEVSSHIRSPSSTRSEPCALGKNSSPSECGDDTSTLVSSISHHTSLNTSSTPKNIKNNENSPQELVHLPPFKNIIRKKTTPDGQRSYITEIICITNNNIEPVSIASTNSNIINLNEVPNPELFTVQELKSPPSPKFELTTAISPSTLTTAEKQRIANIMTDSTSTGITKNKKHFGPSLKQKDINEKKERLSRNSYVRVRASYQNSPSAQKRSLSSANAPYNDTSRDSPATVDSSYSQTDVLLSTESPVAAGRQRNPNSNSGKILSLDDILKSMQKR